MFGFPSGRARPTAPTLTAAEAVRLAERGEVVVIDVRNHDEIARSGKAAPATVVPLMVLPMQADPRSPEFNPVFDTDKPIALYCASGNRSGQAARFLQDLGHDNVHNIGGLAHWLSAGGALAQA